MVTCQVLEVDKSPHSTQISWERYLQVATCSAADSSLKLSQLSVVCFKLQLRISEVISTVNGSWGPSSFNLVFSTPGHHDNQSRCLAFKRHCTFALSLISPSSPISSHCNKSLSYYSKGSYFDVKEKDLQSFRPSMGLSSKDQTRPGHARLSATMLGWACVAI